MRVKRVARSITVCMCVCVAHRPDYVFRMFSAQELPIVTYVLPTLDTPATPPFEFKPTDPASKVAWEVYTSGACRIAAQLVCMDASL